MRYVCLLRGINVGGNHLVSMKRLKELLIDVGLEKVVTYINSGNIIFDSIFNEQKLTPLVEGIITTNFNIKSKIVVYTKDDYLKIVQQIPTHFQNNDQFKADVIFYLEGVTKELLDGLKFRLDIEEVIKLDNALIYGVKRENQTKSTLVKMIGTPLYHMVTIRNVNTARKLAELLIS